MSDTRVLLTTYPTAFLNKGGGEIELVGIAKALRSWGVWADCYGPEARPLREYDAVLHFSVIPDGKSIFREAKSAGKRTMLSPSLWWRKEPSVEERRSVEEFVRAADMLVLKSRSEFDNISQYLDIDSEKVIFCKWGVDPAFEEPVDRNLFRNAQKLDEYILSLGMIEESKNQLNVIHALEHSDTPVVFVGDYRDRRYYEACVKVAPQKFRFLPFMQPRSEMLRSALQGCAAYIECPLEPPGLSAIEAALSRVPMVLSEGEWTEEHFQGLVETADPLSIDDIASALGRATRTGVNPNLYGKARNYELPQTLEPLARYLGR